MVVYDFFVGWVWVLFFLDESVMSGGEIDGFGSSGLMMGLFFFVR